MKRLLLILLLFPFVVHAQTQKPVADTFRLEFEYRGPFGPKSTYGYRVHVKGSVRYFTGTWDSVDRKVILWTDSLKANHYTRNKQ